MYFIKPPVLLKLIYPEALWNIPTNKSEIYLTFDDGPIPEVTPWVLEQLKLFNASATFFCVGENVNKHPEIFQEVKNAGHSIGNHTYNHLNGWNCSKESYLKNIEECNNYTRSNLFRPPYGRLKFNQYKELKKRYKIVLWDVLSGDFDTKLSGEKCLENVIKNTKKGSILVFHDSLKAEMRLKYALPKVLEYYSEKGFIFKSLPVD
jgi:peptidoglycan-N-acetylglucosamine deacetylase